MAPVLIKKDFAAFAGILALSLVRVCEAAFKL